MCVKSMGQMGKKGDTEPHNKEVTQGHTTLLS